MSIMTRADVTEIVGPAVSENLVVEIIGSGASADQLQEAVAWLAADDAMTREGRHQPAGVVARLCEILARVEMEYDRE